MINKKNRRFKDDIKKTFIIYALIPVVIVTFCSYIISFSIWYRTVVDRNRRINIEVSGRIETVLSSYMQKAYYSSSEDRIIRCILLRQEENREIYEDYYSFKNSMDIRCNFFIFDNSLSPILASSTKIPEYAKPENAFALGIGRRMLETPDQVVLLQEIYDADSRQILSVGKAVEYNGKIIGYITFDLDETDLTRIISENFSVNVVVTDQFSNVISSTNALLTNIFGKLDNNFRNLSGDIKSTNDRHFITKSDILNNSLSIYTITSIGYFSYIYNIVGILLIILFIMLAVTMYFSARRIAGSKTKAMDEIIRAIENVRNGDLDTHLNIQTNDEFQIIAESYNQMLIDIKKLIEVNKEKARQSVLSEIKQLESQFNPHFLFNTLEMIKYMTKIDPASVNKIIQSLSVLLRYSISNANSEVTLGEDIEYTKNYLFIQKHRFGKQFDYTINVEDAAGECIVPKLIVQPIIENAIKYGFERKKTLCVKIRASFVEEKLVIVIYDDGIGIEPDVLGEIRQILKQGRNSTAHIGLFNVHRRIQLIYGEKYGVELMSEKNQGTMVKIILPINRGGSEYAGSVSEYVESIDC
ncbi:MAG: histidine kinase [Clostridiaceae bacterium]